MVKLLKDSQEWKAELTIELNKIKRAADAPEGSKSDSNDDTGQDGSYSVCIQWVLTGSSNNMYTRDLLKAC